MATPQEQELQKINEKYNQLGRQGSESIENLHKSIDDLNAQLKTAPQEDHPEIKAKIKTVKEAVALQVEYLQVIERERAIVLKKTEAARGTGGSDPRDFTTERGGMRADSDEGRAEL